MAVFIMLTRLHAEAVRAPAKLEELEGKVMERVRSSVPDVEWLSSYAVLGPYDYLDIFRAPDIDAAAKVSVIVRTFGHAYTEIWAADEWDRFKGLVRDLPAGD